MTTRVRVLVADDHPLYREGVARAIRDRPDLELVAEAADGPSALERSASSRPTWRSSTCDCPAWTAVGR